MNTRVPGDAEPPDDARGSSRSGVPSDPRFHAAAWAAVVAIALFATGPETGAAAPWLRRFEEMGGDKLVHGVLFFVQSWLLVRALRPAEGGVLGAALLAAVLSAGYGAASEVVQALLPARSPEVADLVADAVGAVAGAGLAAYLTRRRARRRARRR